MYLELHVLNNNDEVQCIARYLIWQTKWVWVELPAIKEVTWPGALTNEELDKWLEETNDRLEDLKVIKRIIDR